jgi:hypothetical protein
MQKSIEDASRRPEASRMPEITIKHEDSRKPQGGQRHRGCLRIATKHSRELREESPAPDLAVIFAKEIWRLHGLPSDIVSDRDTRFTSHLWQEPTNHLGIKLSTSTAFHPQADGQQDTTSARRACIQHRRFRDNQDVPVLREVRLPTRPAVSTANFTNPASELLLARR